REYEFIFFPRVWLGSAFRSSGHCQPWANSCSGGDKDRGFRRRLFLVHPARVRQGPWRCQNRGGLLWGNRAKPHLPARHIGKDKLSRINRNHLRPNENFLRETSRLLLATKRSNLSRRPVHQHRTEL